MAEAEHGCSQRRRVARRDQEAAHLVGDDVGNAPHLRRHHGRPESHRLHEHERSHLPGRKQQRIRGQEHGRGVGNRAHEVDLR